MPRPRFHKLAPDQQHAIVSAALAEFSAHGFAAASLNRIIDAAGISKGSMYYYFDGKEDLYGHVTRMELGRLFEGAGPFPIPVARDPDAFWSTLGDHYLRIVAALAASPEIAALARGWITASASAPLQQVQREMATAVVPWFEQVIAAGQRARAIRKDIPTSLVIAVVFGMGQALDTWLLTQDLDAASMRRFVPVFLDLFRRALAPGQTR